MVFYLNERGEPNSPVEGGFFIVSRQKLAGPGTHYGVLATGFWGRPDEVFHLTDRGYESISFEDFARGRQVTLHEGVPPTAAQDVIQRAAALRHWKPAYDLLANNCEHVARFVVTGERKSEQVSSLLGLVVVVIVLVALAR